MGKDGDIKALCYIFITYVIVANIVDHVYKTAGKIFEIVAV